MIYESFIELDFDLSTTPLDVFHIQYDSLPEFSKNAAPKLSLIAAQ